MLLTTAIELSPEVQLTSSVQGAVVLSLKWQFAVSGDSVWPTGMEVKGAVTVTEVRTAAVTRRVERSNASSLESQGRCCDTSP